MLNQPPMPGIRRVAQLDDANRISAQYSHDRGMYSRPAVGPVEYAEGNIKKSTALGGPAGYNQRNIPLPMSPDDMSQAEYLISLNEANPKARQAMQGLTAIPKQAMIQGTTIGDNYPYRSSNMVNNLLSLAKAKRDARQ